ncbi:MAG: hypothetical protein JNJ46_02770 [Myxococcales bacterium]|nr:hypothetical protein [Myxococcales bacterium]
MPHWVYQAVQARARNGSSQEWLATQSAGLPSGLFFRRQRVIPWYGERLP